MVATWLQAPPPLHSTWRGTRTDLRTGAEAADSPDDWEDASQLPPSSSSSSSASVLPLALAYYVKAAQHSEPPVLAQAQFSLGECFERGWGTAVELNAARSWYAKAAAQGEDKRCAALARLTS